MAKTNSNVSKSTKGYNYTSIVIASLAIAGAYIFVDKTATLNRFSEAVTGRLCDMLPQKTTVGADEQSITADATPNEKPKFLNRQSSYNPKFPGGKSYNAKDAMDARYHKVQEICNRYSDVMTPQSSMSKVVPSYENFFIHGSSGLAFCGINGLGFQSFEALFLRTRDASPSESSQRAAWKENYPKAAKAFKKAIFVRHPMERLLSVYRKNFAAAMNPVAGTQDEEQISFPDFIHLVVHGPSELAEFITENQLEGQSLGLDTGMVDGKGQSKTWNSYWHHCGLCNPDFKPHFILHFDHALDDEKVLLEVMGNPESGLEWLNVKHEHIAALEEAIEFYYGQLTKSDIRAIYTKYQPDFELFGYNPDYYVQFGQGD